MIGTSLALGILTGNPATEADKALLDAAGGPKALLERFRALGVGAIELRSVRPDTPRQITQACAALVLEAGLALTIHATLTDTDARSFYAALDPALKLLPKDHIRVPLTVHPLRTGSEPLDQSGTVRLLRLFADEAERRGLNVALALENCRIHRSGLSIMDCQGVTTTALEADRKNVGVCFDFGHLYSNFLTFPECTPFLPPEPFLRAAVHTHIHGVTGTTHCPLTDESLPLEDYLRHLIGASYGGIYNLELECGRFWRDMPPLEGFETSLDRLTRCLEALGVSADAEPTAP